MGKCCDSVTNLALQYPVVLPTVPWETLEFVTDVNEIIKIYGRQKFEPKPTA